MDVVLKVVSGELETVTKEEKQQFESLYRSKLAAGYYVAQKDGKYFWSNKHPLKAVKQLNALPEMVRHGFFTE